MLATMRIRNVHERVLAVAPEDAARLIDGLAGPDDLFWPAAWPAIAFDRPLAVDAEGGHGPISYRVSAYEPGRRVECTFTPRYWLAQGLEGCHVLSIRAMPDGCALHHELGGTISKGMLWRWPLIVRPLHDALIEDAFDSSARALGVAPERPAAWSPWVRVLRWMFGLGRRPRQARPMTPERAA